MSLNRWLGVCVAVSALVVAALGAILMLDPGREASSSSRAPAFTLKDQAGREHSLQDYRGRPVVLTFYPGPDAESIQGLKSLAGKIRQFDEEGIKLFAISRGDTAAQKEMHDREKLPFPLLGDPDGAVAAAYGVTPEKAPTGRAVFVVGPRGTVLQILWHVQPYRQGEQSLTLAQCCLLPTRELKVKGLGKPVADFALNDVLTGKEVRLAGGEKPRATVLLFVSAECPCSRGYDERIAALAQDYRALGVRFLAINSGREPERAILEHARKAGYAFPILRDPKSEVAQRLGAQLTPEVFILDAAGVMRYHGRIDDSREPAAVRSNDARNALDALLAGRLPVRQDVTPFGCAIASARP